MDTSIMCHFINKAILFDHLVFIVQLVANHPLKQFCVMCKPRCHLLDWVLHCSYLLGILNIYLCVVLDIPC